MMREENATQELLDEEIMTKEPDSIRTLTVPSSKGAIDFFFVGENTLVKLKRFQYKYFLSFHSIHVTFSVRFHCEFYV